MDEYGSPYYVSIIPRILPSEYSSKKIPMIDEEYPYIDNRSVPSYVSPTKGQKSSINSQPLSIRNDFNQEENISHTNSHDNLLKGRSNNRFHHEPLKGNTENYLPRNSPSEYSYPMNSDSKLSDNPRENSSENIPKKTLITFAILIGLFAVTTLAISIYLVIRMTKTTTSG